MPSIAISGFKRAGKDQVFDALHRAAGFTRVSMADPIYDEVARAFGVTPEFLHDDQVKDSPRTEMALRRCQDPDFVALIQSHEGDVLDEDTPRSPRFVLQLWGTEYRRGQSPDYWTRLAQQTLHQTLQEHPDSRLACTDVRFENESEIWATLPMQSGNQHWLVVRPWADMDQSRLDHPSEQLWRVKPAEQWSHVLINDGTLDDLYDEVLLALTRHWPQWELHSQDRVRLAQAHRRWQPEIHERNATEFQPGDRLLRVDANGRAQSLGPSQFFRDASHVDRSGTEPALVVRGADAQQTVLELQRTVLDLQRRRLPAREEAALRAYGLTTRDIRYISLYGIDAALSLSEDQCPTFLAETLSQLRQGVGMAPDVDCCNRVEVAALKTVLPR